MQLSEKILSPRERLKRFREHVQASQRELAQVFGVAPGAIAMWEKGTREISGPGLILLEHLELEFGLVESQMTDASLEAQHVSRLLVEKIVGRTSRLKETAKDRAQLVSFRGAVNELLERNLSQSKGSRRLQVSLLEKILDTLADVKGLPLKIIQLASIVDLGLSYESRQALVDIQNSLSPMPAKNVKEIFLEEFGVPPEELFWEWNPAPIAAASIGQVHVAKLKTGEKVAVKIQYPNIHKKVVLQTQIIKLLSSMVALARKDYSEMLADFVQKIRNECDYRNEAEFHQRFFEAFQGNEQIIIPRLYKDYCKARIITTEYIDGRDFHTFVGTASQEQKNIAGSIIHRFNYESTMIHGLLPADMHPGNYIFLNGKVAFLDFGRTLILEPQILENSKNFYYAIHMNNPQLAEKIMQEAGYVRNWQGFDFSSFWPLIREQMEYELTDHPVKFTKDYVRRIWRMGSSFKQRGQLTMTPQFFWPVFSSMGLWGILAELEAEFQWRKNIYGVFSLKERKYDGECRS